MCKYYLLLFWLLFLTSNLSAKNTGIASWYCIKCNGGKHTASGIPLKDNGLTAAHKKLPFGSVVEVLNLRNKKSVVVKITDDGPHIKGRIIDLTKGAFSRIANLDKGLVKVKIKILHVPKDGEWRK